MVRIGKVRAQSNLLSPIYYKSFNSRLDIICLKDLPQLKVKVESKDDRDVLLQTNNNKMAYNVRDISKEVLQD